MSAPVDEWLAEHYPAAESPCPLCPDMLATVVRLGDEADRLITQRSVLRSVLDGVQADYATLLRLVLPLVDDLRRMDGEQAIELDRWPAAKALVEAMGA